VLAARRIRADGTGFHVRSAMKSNLHPVPFRFSQHLGCGFAGCDLSDIKAFLFNLFLNLLSFFFLHYFSSFVDFYSSREY
jgi:predicted component of type VI protein secretion system